MTAPDWKLGCSKSPRRSRSSSRLRRPPPRKRCLLGRLLRRPLCRMDCRSCLRFHSLARKGWMALPIAADLTVRRGTASAGGAAGLGPRRGSAAAGRGLRLCSSQPGRTDCWLAAGRRQATRTVTARARTASWPAAAVAARAESWALATGKHSTRAVRRRTGCQRATCSQLARCSSHSGAASAIRLPEERSRMGEASQEPSAPQLQAWPS